MRTKNWISSFVVITLATVVTFGASLAARADDPPHAAASNLPESERDLLAIVAGAQKQAASGTTRDARMGLQVSIISYMQKSRDFQDWVGTVASRGITPEGKAWISIDIGNGVTIATWRTEGDDEGYSSLVRPKTQLFGIMNTAMIAQPVTFSGYFLKSVLASDDDMVARPQFIVRFSALKVAR
jgi:hypothetical protein